MKMYKQFRIRDGKLYPLFVNSNKETPMGVWLNAESGDRTADGKVKSKLGGLAYRPGWHLADMPYAGHIGLKDKNGKVVEAHPDTVWAECEVCTDINYTPEARENGWRGGKWSARRAQLDRIPENGYYTYKTNPKNIGTWVIAGRIKVNRVLSYEEEQKICAEHGVVAQKRNHPIPYIK